VLAQESASESFALEGSSLAALALVSSSESYTMTATVGAPVAAGPLAATLFTAAAGFLNDLDADGDGVSGALDLCPAQFAGCNDADADGCVDLPDTDADGDGFGRGACDCDDAVPQVWGRPGEVRDVRFAGPATLVWNAPTNAGGPQPRYDTVRSPSASDFVTSAICLESDDASDRQAPDSENPPSGTVFFYLVRAENSCAAGVGPLGISRGVWARVARGCS
jgi:hypothetical protein